MRHTAHTPVLCAIQGTREKVEIFAAEYRAEIVRWPEGSKIALEGQENQKGFDIKSLR